MRWFGIDRDKRNYKGKDFRLENDIAEYGYKFHMNDISATIGLHNLPHIPELLEEIGLEKPEGAYIKRVDPATPASRAGLRAGDVILEFDGAKVRGAKDIFFKVAEVDPGTKVSVRVLRMREPKIFEVTLTERPRR